MRAPYSVDNTIMKDLKSLKKKIVLDESGQTFLEFVLLMATMVLLSFAVLNSFNAGLANIWKSYIRTISHPTDTNIDL